MNPVFLTALKHSQLIPVIEFSDLAQVKPALEILAEYQFNVIEITLRHACAYDAVKIALKDYPNMCIGVGSILQSTQLTKLAALNIQFAVSPGLTDDLLAQSKNLNFSFMPGVMTPSEILLGIEQGIHLFKFFPAEAAGGVQLLKSFAGPFKEVQFCPTGGIRLDNMQNYLALPNVLCVGASWFISAQDLVGQNWQKIRALTKEAKSVIS